MSKMHKILLSVMCVLLVVSVIVAVATKNSYVQIIPDDALVSPSSYTDEEFKKVYCNKNKVLKQLESAENVFAVTVKNQEYTYQCTKTTVMIDKVKKGDASLVGEEVVVYEPNFIDYYKSSDRTMYRRISTINNLMQEGKSYLLFCEEKEYAQSYQKLLKIKEFKVNIDFDIYSFPINEKIEYIDDYVDKFSDYKSYSFFCCTQTQSEHVDEIRQEVFGEYM